MYQRWISYGKPSPALLANLQFNLCAIPTHWIVTFVVIANIGIAATHFHIARLAGALLCLAGGGLAAFASAAYFGFRILDDIEEDYGPGSAAKLVACLPTKGPLAAAANLDAIIGHPPRSND